MSVAIAALPVIGFFDSNGRPAYNGKVTTYIAGTSTLAPTYTDATGTVANTNPIQLNERGECEIWYDTSLTYDLAPRLANGTALPRQAGLNAGSALTAQLSASTGSTLVNSLSPATGAIPRSLAQELQTAYNAARFGVIGDGSTDDTAALQKAIDFCAASTRNLRLVGSVGNVFKVTAPLRVNGGLQMYGEGRYGSVLRASGNFTALLLFGATAAGCKFQSIGLDTTGTTTQCAFGTLGSQVIEWDDINVSGDLSGSLVYTAGSFWNYINSSFLSGSSTTTALQYDSACLNSHVSCCNFGGTGSGIAITATLGPLAGGTGPQGTRVENSIFETTGAFCINVGGQAFQTHLVGNVIDQGVTKTLVIGAGASLTQVVGNWIGATGTSTGTAVLVDASVGAGTIIHANNINGGNNCIQIGASSTLRAASVTITDNVFVGAKVNTLSLDSVNGCTILNNTDLSTPTNGSFAILKTNAAAGAYTFGNNSWSVNPITTLNLTSASVHASLDRGVTFANKGSTSSTAGSGTLVINHGCVSTPNVIMVTPNGDVGTYSVTMITPTQFTIAFSNGAAAHAFSWTAELFS